MDPVSAANGKDGACGKQNRDQYDQPPDILVEYRIEHRR